MSEKIECPKCGNEFSVAEALSSEIEEKFKKKFQKDALKKEAEIEKIQEDLENEKKSLLKKQADMEKTIQEKLLALNLTANVQVIDGSTPLKKRAEILQRFDHSDLPCILLMTLKTGGVGLNLTRANYVFHIDPWWNPQVENQATDRTRRIGQKKCVQIYKYIMKDSLEEKIQLLKDDKQQLFSSFLDEDTIFEQQSDTKKQRRQLTKDDFTYLLKTEALISPH